MKIGLSALSPEPRAGLGSNFVDYISDMVLRTD